MPVKFNVSVKLYLLLFIAAASLIGLGLYGIKELAKMNANTQTLYADRVVPFQQLSNVRFQYNTEIVPIAQRVKNHSISFTEANRRIRSAQQVINTNWHAYQLTYLTPEEKVLFKQADQLKKQVDETCRELILVLSRNDETALSELIKKRFSADPDPYVVKLTALMDLQLRVGKQLFNSNNKIYNNTSKEFIFIIALSLLVAVSLFLIIIKNIKKLIKTILKSSSIIKESEEKYQSLFEQASDAIYVCNANGYFTNVNNSMCQLTGYSRDELLKMTVGDLLNADLLRLNPLMYAKANPGDSIKGERKFIHKAGCIVDIEVNGKKFSDDRVLVILRDITDRKKMEAELKKAELRFRTLADKSMVGIYIVQKGKFVYVNPRFAEVFGYEPMELIGTLPVTQIIHPDYRNLANENVRARMDDEKTSVHYEAMGIKKDGTSNWVEFYGSRVDMDDEPTIIGSMIDITERRLAEDELRLSEQKYKMLFDSSPMPLLMVDKNDLSIIAANEEATRLYGYTNQELLKMTIRDMRHPDDKDKVWDNFKLSLKTSSDRGIFKHVKKNGAELSVQVIAHDILFEGKKVRLGLYNDLTEKIKAEQLHEKTEANLQTILNTTDTAYALLDRNLDVLEYNNKALIFAKNEFGFDPDSGGKFFEHLPNSRRPQFAEYAKRVFAGHTVSYEVAYNPSDAGDVWYYVRMFPISNKDNEILGLVLAITDITERKNAEQSLQSAYDQIKTQIKFIREMVWKQSHVLRSPLANLKGLTTILQNTPDDKEVLAFIQIELDRMDKVFMEMAEDSSNDEMNF
ncbi:MAG: PAS domain S-box protein [Mucilaginibacter sp.]|nr:PAS domain S-box protein [Mucilaginibacter sp.]